MTVVVVKINKAVVGSSHGDMPKYMGEGVALCRTPGTLGVLLPQCSCLSMAILGNFWVGALCLFIRFDYHQRPMCGWCLTCVGHDVSSTSPGWGLLPLTVIIVLALVNSAVSPVGTMRPRSAALLPVSTVSTGLLHLSVGAHVDHVRGDTGKRHVWPLPCAHHFQCMTYVHPRTYMYIYIQGHYFFFIKKLVLLCIGMWTLDSITFA